MLLISNPQFTWLKLDDQPRDLEHWVTVEQSRIVGIQTKRKKNTLSFQ